MTIDGGNNVDTRFFPIGGECRSASYLQKHGIVCDGDIAWLGWSTSRPICRTLMMTTGDALSEAPFIIALITAGSIDCPSITLATRTRCGRPGHPRGWLTPLSPPSPSLLFSIPRRHRRGCIFGPVDSISLRRRGNETHRAPLSQASPIFLPLTLT